MEAALDWLVQNRTLLVIIVAALVVLIILQRLLGLAGRMFRSIRRIGKPVTLHPKLQAYAGRSEDELNCERLLATRIIATSSTSTVAGYEIVRQIEAVFVEGHRTTQEAATALKACAADRGANAIINLSQQRTAAGKCSAQGDAVVVEPNAPRGAKS